MKPDERLGRLPCRKHTMGVGLRTTCNACRRKRRYKVRKIKLNPVSRLADILGHPTTTPTCPSNPWQKGEKTHTKKGAADFLPQSRRKAHHSQARPHCKFRYTLFRKGPLCSSWSDRALSWLTKQLTNRTRMHNSRVNYQNQDGVAKRRSRIQSKARTTSKTQVESGRGKDSTKCQRWKNPHTRYLPNPRQEKVRQGLVIQTSFELVIPDGMTRKQFKM